MPLNVDRTSIGLHQAARHEHALERTERKPGSAAEAVQTEDTGVTVDVRVNRGTSEEITNFARAEDLVQRVRGDAIAKLRGVHAGLDPNRAAALLAD